MSGTVPRMEDVPWVRGLVCEAVLHEPDISSWVFRFGPSVSLRVDAPWRVLAGGRIQVGGEDDGELFGLPRPVDAGARAMELLHARTVREFLVDSRSGDVTVDFGDGHLLQVFNASSGYEGWTLDDGASTRLLVGMGGGGIAEWGSRTPGDGPP